MSLLEPYQEVLGVRSEEELVSLFLQTLSPTNRTYDFFVDWNKVQRHVQAVRVEIALLSSLAGAQDPAEELRNLLERYPEVSKAIPILLLLLTLQTGQKLNLLG